MSGVASVVSKVQLDGDRTPLCLQPGTLRVAFPTALLRPRKGTLAKLRRTARWRPIAASYHRDQGSISSSGVTVGVASSSGVRIPEMR